jgi:hypothetical protein
VVGRSIRYGRKLYPKKSLELMFVGGKRTNVGKLIKGWISKGDSNVDGIDHWAKSLKLILMTEKCVYSK